MATASVGREGITIPTWFLAVAAAAFFTVSATVAFGGIVAWSDIRDNKAKNIEQDIAIKQIRDLQIGFAEMKADIGATKDLARSTNEKLDRLIERELRK